MTTPRQLLRAFAALNAIVAFASAFQPRTSSFAGRGQTTTSSSSSPASRTTSGVMPRRRSSTAALLPPLYATTTTKATLDEGTTWQLRFVLNRVPTNKGKRANELLFVTKLHFIEEEGYEPPQGEIRQVDVEVSSTPGDDDEDGNDEAEDLPSRGRLGIAGGRWQLSEDPEDRKDGLWIWGLFKEPLYPFMLLQMETEEVSLGGEGEEADSVGPLKLFAQISHVRDDTAGVVLKSATVNVRQMETMKADLFGAAKVDVYEEVGVGQVSFQPMVSSSVEK
mmetsp:Transcript_7955/g.9746  ORF Transcript_7955/g.9746 Transcript_7955/m.9746 type:complete len:279 (-) Transcript_7955:11-847(-)